MSKSDDFRRAQREFFFVINGTTEAQAASQPNDRKPTDSRDKRLSSEDIRAHRDRLISDLREFGC